MIFFRNDSLPFILSIFIPFFVGISAISCAHQTKSEEMIDFSRYVPKKTIEIEIDKQAQSEFVLLPDKKIKIRK